MTNDTMKINGEELPIYGLMSVPSAVLVKALSAHPEIIDLSSFEFAVYRAPTSTHIGIWFVKFLNTDPIAVAADYDEGLEPGVETPSFS
jgi:hypothetical protein